MSALIATLRRDHLGGYLLVQLGYLVGPLLEGGQQCLIQDETVF